MRYVFILLLVLVVYAVVDCIRSTDAEMPSGLPKAVWVVLIIVFPGAGAIAWLVVSRVTRHAQRAATPGPAPFGGRPTRPSPRRPVTRQVAPDDDPEFLASLDRPDPPKSDEHPERGAPQEREGADEPDDADDDDADTGGSAAGGTDEDGGPGTRR